MKLVLLVVLGAPIFAGTIDISVSCSAGKPPVTMTGNSNCSVSSNDPNPANAYAQISADFSATSFDIVASAFANDPNLPDTNADAVAMVSFADSLFTNGPIRSGILKVTTVKLFGDDFGGGTGFVDFQFGSVGLDCSGFACPTMLPTIGFPFTLGQPFQFSVSAGANGASSREEGAGDGLISASIAFQLFEADGVTPVAVIEDSSVPEPSSLALSALGLLALLSALRTSRKP